MPGRLMSPGLRIMSGFCGHSILITSAPSVPSHRQPHGPARTPREVEHTYTRQGLRSDGRLRLYLYHLRFLLLSRELPDPDPSI